VGKNDHHVTTIFVEGGPGKSRPPHLLQTSGDRPHGQTTPAYPDVRLILPVLAGLSPSSAEVEGANKFAAMNKAVCCPQAIDADSMSVHEPYLHAGLG